MCYLIRLSRDDSFVIVPNNIRVHAYAPYAEAETPFLQGWLAFFLLSAYIGSVDLNANYWFSVHVREKKGLIFASF